MWRLLKLLVIAGLVIYLALGEGSWPTTARVVWHTLDQVAGRRLVRASVRLLDYPATRDAGTVVVTWLWSTRDPHEQEVIRRYLELRGYAIR